MCGLAHLLCYYGESENGGPDGAGNAKSLIAVSLGNNPRGKTGMTELSTRRSAGGATFVGRTSGGAPVFAAQNHRPNGRKHLNVYMYGITQTGTVRL